MLLSPLGGAVVEVPECRLPWGPSRWVEVRWNHDDGQMQLRTYEDDEVADWPEYGSPS